MDLEVGDVFECGVVPAVADVVFDDAAVVVLGAGVDILRVELFVGVEELAEGGLAGGGVAPLAASLVGLHVVGVVLCGGFGGEAIDRADGV
ncbi:hypothetical protein [Kutzneria sp. NPDC052558]|uniref:hypothetical protein n=1 Tax=Kutzneria sp. NPDC052558 TaxID=3364121 RepID=UPI0037C6355B